MYGSVHSGPDNHHEQCDISPETAQTELGTNLSSQAHYHAGRSLFQHTVQPVVQSQRIVNEASDQHPHHVAIGRSE